MWNYYITKYYILYIILYINTIYIDFKYILLHIYIYMNNKTKRIIKKIRNILYIMKYLKKIKILIIFLNAMYK